MPIHPTAAVALGMLGAATVPGLAVTPARAEAPPVCAPRAAWVQALQERLAQEPMAMAVSRGGRLLEVFASTDGATWTALVTAPTGMRCFVAAGEHWSTRGPNRTPNPPDIAS
ncbi:MAG: hypothetical protein ACOCYE_05540 [Pseudomonadota bacterium]